MNQNNHSFFLFGGGFLTGMKPWLEKLGTLSGEMLGVSPLSRFKGNGNELVEWLPVLEEELRKSQAEYFILDLQTARQKLIASAGCYVSSAGRSLAALKRKELAQVDPHLLPREQTEAALDAFVETVKKYFAPDHIILLCTNLADFWMAGDQYRPHQPPMFSGFQKRWIAGQEQIFRDKTGCRFVDVSRFYFLKKEPGRPLTEMIFEDACYEDVAGHIADILAGGSGESLRPDFSLSLDRYVKYHFTMQRKPQRVYLDAARLPDDLVLCAQAGFVTKYREELIALDALDWSCPETALEAMKKKAPKAPFTQIVLAFDALRRERYEEDLDYGLLFRSGVAPDSLVAYLKKEYAPRAGLRPGQINQYNAGYHFAKMRGLDPAAFSTEMTVAEPTLIDVFGSCISRTLFNVQDNDFAVDHYWFHVPPLEYRNKPVDCPPELFPEKINWTDRLVKQQFACEIYADIQKSEAKWLALDLYSLISPNTRLYQDCLYGDFDHRISNALKAQRVDLWKTPNVIAKDHDELLAALNPWLKLLKKKYGSNIILVDGQRQDHWLGDDGLIYALPQVSSACNEFMGKAFSYVQKKLGCYGLRMGQYFLPDEVGYMRNTPAHKEDLGYQAAHDAIRHIVDHQPSRKMVTQYSGAIHIDHLLRLMEKNAPETLAAALPLSDLDRAVIQLQRDDILRWKDGLEALYDSSDWADSLKSVLGKNTVDPELAAALTQVPSALKAEIVERKDYLVYPSESPFLTGGQGRHGFPVLPAIKVRRMFGGPEGVVASWTVAAGTMVRVYRKAPGGFWELAGKSQEGQFIDRNVAANTEYQYTFCVEFERNGRYFLGRFTGVTTVRTDLQTPVLRSAVHVAGVNTLTWAPVEGAELYWVYHKNGPGMKWERCAVLDAADTVRYSEEGKVGQCYTVRALRMVEGTPQASGFQPGLFAAEL